MEVYPSRAPRSISTLIVHVSRNLMSEELEYSMIVTKAYAEISFKDTMNELLELFETKPDLIFIY